MFERLWMLIEIRWGFPDEEIKKLMKEEFKAAFLLGQLSSNKTRYDIQRDGDGGIILEILGEDE